jgi:hypothetical protein
MDDRPSPFTSAPEEKKRPFPVKTVKMVLGWSLSSLRAAMSSIPRLSPNALSLFGRFNFILLASDQMNWLTTNIYDPDLSFNLNNQVLVAVRSRHLIRICSICLRLSKESQFCSNYKDCSTNTLLEDIRTPDLSNPEHHSLGCTTIPKARLADGRRSMFYFT